MSKLRALRDKGYGIIMTTHSPDQAFLCDAKVVLLRQDGTMDFGPAAQVITERSMQEVYGIDVRVVEFYDRNEQLVRLCAPLLGRF
jgi:iron complex transport system ATP-binding protein